MSHGAAGPGQTTPSSVFHDRGRFGRLFPALPPFAADTPSMRAALTKLGAPGGPMDARDKLDASPKDLITEPSLSLHNPDNPTLTAGFTFFGQFVDHDMTFDPTSSLARRQDPEAIRNFRIPALDLDSVYGGGPAASPHLYDHSVAGGRTTMLVEEIPGSAAVSRNGAVRHDVPRNAQGVALLGDPRNDENLIVSQLHLAMLKFHNAVVADLAGLGPGYTDDEIFDEAQRLVRWHYQWLVLHEFLPGTVGAVTAEDVLRNGRKYYSWNNDPFIPVEFSVAAYRFGHSQVRPSYRANFGGADAAVAPPFFARIFDTRLPDSADPDDLRGGKRAARRFVDWETFFDFGDNLSRPNKRIDTTLSSALFDLMGQPPATPTSLATRNLLRALTMGVPSGQRVAAAMGLPALEDTALKDLDEQSLDRRTPLWFYLLREAEVAAAGRHLGPVGGRIVAEVLIGLIEGDGQSYLRQDAGWTPTYAGPDGRFGFAEFFRKAGVVA